MPGNFKLPGVCGERQDTGGSTSNFLLGEPAVVQVRINGYDTRALLDTGATISVISSRLAEQVGERVQPVQQLLNVECANGERMPYEGFTNVTFGLTENKIIMYKEISLWCPMKNVLRQIQ